MITDAINERYSSLSESSCCLSCGGAINFAFAQEGEFCVDLGSGRGNDVIRLAEIVGNEGFVFGVDISEGMLSKAKSTIDRFGVKNAILIKTNLENILIDNNTIDLVISNCTINHAENKQAVWSEIFRILKPGGRFVVSDIYATSIIPEEYKNDPQAVAECWGGADTRGNYLTTLENTGFENIAILEESKPYAKGKVEVASFTIKGFKPKDKVQ